MFASAYYHSDFRTGPMHNHTERVVSPKELDAAKHKMLILWGGEDISPSLYGQKKVRAHAGDTPSTRDQIEWNLAKAAVKMGIPILGICRGAQMLCAVGGGALYQHVTNHGSQHEVTYKDIQVIGNSCHHQMLIPTEDMEVLATTACLSPKKWIDQDDPIEVHDLEPEIVYMPKLKALGVQGHPEWMSYDSGFVKLVRSLIGEKFHVEV